MSWSEIATPADAPPPRPLTMRAQTIPPRGRFPEHAHDWGQFVYAVTGVLSVNANACAFVISPEQAVWLPAGVAHRVGSLLGAEFRSLWIATDAATGLPGQPAVLEVSALLKALIGEVAALDGAGRDAAYLGRLTRLILDQLRRAAPLPRALPWPRSAGLVRMGEALSADPADTRSAEAWARELGMSSRTLARRFEAEVGMPFRTWRRRMRLFKAIELLGGGADVTSTALDLGYGSPSAFIYAFRREVGASPLAWACLSRPERRRR